MSLFSDFGHHQFRSGCFLIDTIPISDPILTIVSDILSRYQNKNLNECVMDRWMDRWMDGMCKLFRVMRKCEILLKNGKNMTQLPHLKKSILANITS